MTLYDQNKPNQINALYNAITDYSRLFNAEFTNKINVGDKNVTAESKNLMDIRTQATTANSRDFHSAKGHLVSIGVEQESASSLALFLLTISKLTGKSINLLINEISTTQLVLSPDLYRFMNNLKKTNSQFFLFRSVENRRSLDRTIHQYY